ncbi:GNAT family N-acetyltransferase [Streptomyces sp. TRM76323]|uniref:GNAT family N-acetyltransferase n=1 Tax=Streptomyces tamarix TaxID=3078565 RepID=A0ABU3QF83_9ACTN|nr:GNAT family N-acetyltransferase [Streptomyces tamarix]MDT9681326.1 GNAT family N-acetyltransferase [Streptomyces tamarix]
MEPVTLTSERLLLRPFAPDDAEEVRAAVQDPEISRWIPLPNPYGIADAEDFVGRYVPGAWRDDTEYTFSVRPRDREHGPLLASVSLHHPRAGTWEVGFYTVREHRGNGYATEATRALAHWAFTTLRCTRLEWRAEVGNTASRLVAEKAGFTLEGTLRAAFVHHDTRRDCWLASLLPSDLGLPSALPYLPSRHA